MSFPSGDRRSSGPTTITTAHPVGGEEIEARGGWRRRTVAAAAGGAEGMVTIYHDVPPNN
jgi:hypothetical protein